jgi:hypothetical protein
MLDWLRKRVVTLEEQVNTLAECGIRLAPGVGLEQILASFPRKEYERDPYQLLLCVMGSEEAASQSIWHFDAECIEDHGDYTTIAERLRDMAQGALPLTNIQDFVDIEAKEAWISFELDDLPVRWEAKVHDDWVDETVLSRIAQLLTARNAGKRFCILDLWGQDCLIGCCTPEELGTLNKRTGLKFEWLT